MAFTDTQICNMALSHIQSKQISNLDTDNGDEGIACRLFYSVARQDILSRFDWSFARRSLQLTINTQSPQNTKYEYQYLRPADAISIRKLTHESDETSLIDYEQGIYVNPAGNAEQRIILCNYPDVLCVYTRDVTSNALFSPGFTLALSYRLAMELCAALNLNNRKQQVAQLFVATMQDAMQDDANQFRDEIKHVDLADEVQGNNSISAYVPIIS